MPKILRPLITYYVNADFNAYSVATLEAKYLFVKSLFLEVLFSSSLLAIELLRLNYTLDEVVYYWIQWGGLLLNTAVIIELICLCSPVGFTSILQT